MLNQKWITRTAHLALCWLIAMGAVHATPLTTEQIIAVDWHEGDKQLAGASRSYSYAAAYISWPDDQMGVWIDQKQVFMGTSSFAQQQISKSKTGKPVSWDVTNLVNRILNAELTNVDLLLRSQDGKGSSLFHSKESDLSKAPRLVITTTNGKKQVVTAAMDSYLDSSTFRSLGHSKTLKAGGSNVSLLRFAIPKLAVNETIVLAQLQLTVSKQFGATDIGVFWLAQPAPQPKILTNFSEKQIIFREEFSDRNWAARWSSLDRRSNVDRVDAPNRPDDYALKVEFNPEQNLALNLVLLLKSLSAEEPETLYFQYDLFLADNWLATRGGGKFPGLAGTYKRAGWGGRSADGSNGWSARGQFGDTVTSDDKFNNSTPLGFYAYYPDNGQNHGATMYWNSGSNPIKPGKWYRITQFVKLNTPGEQNGVLKAWIDQQQVYERSNIRFRDTSDLKIERLWLNFYHGGTAKPIQRMELYIDNVILATE